MITCFWSKNVKFSTRGWTVPTPYPDDQLVPADKLGMSIVCGTTQHVIEILSDVYT